MSNSNAFNDMFKNSWDFSGAAEIQRRNAEAFAEAGQTMFENSQAIARRSAEVAQDNVQHAMEASKEIFSGNPEAAFSKQADFTRDMFESNLANMREMIEIATKSSFEAFDVINQRTAESMQEFSKAAAKPKAAKKSA